MRIEISTEDFKRRIVLPRFLYMNGLAVSVIAVFAAKGISPRQARKALRAVKETMREYNLTSICDVEVIVHEQNGEETVVSIHI